MESLTFLRTAALALSLSTMAPALAQDPPATPPAVEGTPGRTSKPPKAKSRIKLLQQMQTDLDAAMPRVKTDAKGRKKLEKCHETLLDASEQQKRYKSVKQAKVNSCLDDLEKLEDSGAFTDADRDRLQKDREALAESVGKPRLRLPKPF